MFDWIAAVEDWFTQVGDSINTLILDLDELILTIDYYLQLATIYVWASGFMMIVTMVLVIALLSQNRKMQSKIDSMNDYLEHMGIVLSGKFDDK